MKKISLITLNNPGLESAKNILDDLFKINQDFEVIIYHKSSKIDNIKLQSSKKHPKINYFAFNNLDEILYQAWNDSDAMIWFVATGIVIRKIAPFLNSKTIDPAVLVMNLVRTQVIPLLSGHIGGANELAQKLTEVNPDLTAFITTATDSLSVFAFDTFAKKAGYEIINIKELAQISNSLVNGKPINLITYPAVLNFLKQEGLDINDIKFCDYRNPLKLFNANYSTVIISPFENPSIKNDLKDILKIKIKPIILGIGLNRGTAIDELKTDVYNFLEKNNLSLKDISTIASFEAKKDEEALVLLADEFKKNLIFFNDSDINQLTENFSDSKAQKFFNIKGVAEPTAILAAPLKTLFIKKKIYNNTTIAAAF